MNRKFNRRKALWITLFILVVSLSGFALAASGNLENPLGTLVGGSGGHEGRERGTPPSTSGDQTETQPTGTGRGEGGGDQSSFNFSQIGSVLNNVWFLFAITAVVIVVQTIGGGLIQRLKQRIPRAASP